MYQPLDSPRFNLEVLSLPSVGDRTKSSGSVVLILPRKPKASNKKTAGASSSTVVSQPLSQETKLSRTTMIRRDVTARMKRQAALDFAKIVKMKDGIQFGKSVRDMFECEHVPVLGGSSHEDDNRSACVAGGGSFTNSIKNDDTSSIMRSLKSIPRTQGPQTISDHDFHRKQQEMGRGPVLSTSDMNAKLVAASEMHKSGRKILDGSRLFFEAAILYEEIGMFDKAIDCFERCSGNTEDAAKVVDAYDLVQGVEFARKVERMSEGNRLAFLEKRSQLRGSLIAAEKERQRLRSMVSLCQLVRIYLRIDDYKNSHRCLVAAFHTTVSFEEHTELLIFAHETLKEFGSHFYELSKEQQLTRGSAGPLAEAHIDVLHELLEEDAANPDILEWLGRRYAERCDLEESQLYFRRARDLRHPVHIAKDLNSLWKARGSEYDDEGFLLNVVKVPMRRYADVTNNELDRDNIEQRADCAWPNGKHKGSDTIVYRLPPVEWSHAIHGQESRRDMLGLTFKLPLKKSSS